MPYITCPRCRGFVTEGKLHCEKCEKTGRIWVEEKPVVRDDHSPHSKPQKMSSCGPGVPYHENGEDYDPDWCC